MCGPYCPYYIFPIDLVTHDLTVSSPSVAPELMRTTGQLSRAPHHHQAIAARRAALRRRPLPRGPSHGSLRRHPGSTPPPTPYTSPPSPAPSTSPPALTSMRRATTCAECWHASHDSMWVSALRRRQKRDHIATPPSCFASPSGDGPRPGAPRHIAHRRPSPATSMLPILTRTMRLRHQLLICPMAAALLGT
jgi:hypothetical protein